MDIYDVRNLLNTGKSIYEIPLKVCFYARVSTDKIDQQNSLKNQIDYYKEYITNNKFWCYIDGYIDEGISATSVNKRDDFQRMIADAKRGRFDLLITKEISRFSRSTLDSIKYTQELLKYGVGVLFQSDNINTLYPDAELRLTIMSSIAQEEVRKLSERTKFGFKRSIENGKVLGNSNIWGYDKKDGKLYINEKEAELIKLIFETYVNEKIGLRSIVQKLDAMGIKNSVGNIFGISTVKRILQNPKYKGYYCGKKSEVVDYKFKNIKKFNEEDWVLYKDENIPAIVSEELWEKANNILDKKCAKHKAHTGTRNKYPLSCKIFCEEHNSTFHRTIYRSKIENREVWQCEQYKILGSEGCHLPVIYSSEIYNILRTIVKELQINKKEFIDDLLNTFNQNNSKQSIKKQIFDKEQEKLSIKKSKDKLLQHSINGNIEDSEFVERNNEYNELIKKIDKQLEVLNDEIKISDSANSNIQAIRNFLDSDLNFENEFDIDTIDSFLEKIIIKSISNKEKVYLEVILKLGDSYNAEFERKDAQKTLSIKPLLLSTDNGYNGVLGEVKSIRKYGNTQFTYPVSFIYELKIVA